MAEYKIEAQTRTIIGKKVKRLRKQGIVPISVYGPNIDPMPLQVQYRPLEVALMNAGGTNLIDINVDGKAYPVLARDVQRDVMKGTIEHVDFFAVDENTKIKVSIPVNLVGSSPAVVAREGILITGTNAIEVETLPSKIINEVVVDLSELKAVGDSISVGDLKFDEGTTVLNDPEEMLARVSQTSAARAELLEKVLATGEDAVEEEEVSAEVPTVGEDEAENEEDFED